MRFQPVDVLTVGYLALVGLALVLLGGHIERQWLYVAAHLVPAVLILALARRGRASADRRIRFVADWYPVPLYILMYSTANLVNTLIFRDHVVFDRFFQDLDRKIFTVEPSFWLARTLGSPLLHEVIHACYFSYYLLIPGIGVLFYFRPRGAATFQRYLFCVCFTFYASYLVFIVLPVHGPQLLRGDDYAGGVLFVPIMDFIYFHAETGGGAFPSSHVAVALTCLLFARRYSWRVFAIALPVVVGLFIATVYCRYHYAVDSVAGLLWGCLLYRTGNALFSRTWAAGTEGANTAGGRASRRATSSCGGKA